VDENSKPEPWLRGTLPDLPAVHRAVLHALLLAEENANTYCGDLNDQDINATPFGIASVGFHLRHIAGSIDRLLTYAEGSQLTAIQITVLNNEATPSTASSQVLADLTVALQRASTRVRALIGNNLEEARFVGRCALPTTLGGLLVHIADHTQRHIGQAITTAKILRALRQGNPD
jgi:hypothetical protein